METIIFRVNMFDRWHKKPILLKLMGKQYLAAVKLYNELET